METSPTSETIAKSEVKMSGSCQFNTTLPAEEGHYSFSVSFTPRGHVAASYKTFTVGNDIFLCVELKQRVVHLSTNGNVQVH